MKYILFNILRCDVFHCLSLTWEKTFGATVWAHVSDGIRAMLYATSVDEWEQSYKHVEVQCKEKDYVTALECVRNKIYSNPTKYANYRLKEIPSNRFGSIPTEQNH